MNFLRLVFRGDSPRSLARGEVYVGQSSSACSMLSMEELSSYVPEYICLPLCCPQGTLFLIER